MGNPIVFIQFHFWLPMGLQIDTQVQSYPINWKVTIFGFLFFAWRAFAMNSLKIATLYVDAATFTGNDALIFEPYVLFMPDVLHSSYLISLCLCISMIFSFRVKLFNSIPVLVLPSILITIPFKDIPILIQGPEVVGWLYWCNYLTIHIPVLFFGLFMLLMRKQYITKTSYMMGFFFLLIWFFAIDNKVNGVLDIGLYIIVGLIVAIIWLTICLKVLLRDCDSTGDPLFGPVVTIQHISWVKA